MVYHRIPCFKRFRNVYIHGWLATHAKTTKRNASKKHLRKRQPTTCRRLCSTFAVKDLSGRQFTVVALLSDLLAGHQVPGLGHHWLCSGFLPVSFFPGTRKPTCFKWIENGYFHSFPILKDLVHHGIKTEPTKKCLALGYQVCNIDIIHIYVYIYIFNQWI